MKLACGDMCKRGWVMSEWVVSVVMHTVSGKILIISLKPELIIIFNAYLPNLTNFAHSHLFSFIIVYAYTYTHSLRLPHTINTMASLTTPTKSIAGILYSTLKNTSQVVNTGCVCSIEMMVSLCCLITLRASVSS